MKLNKAKRSDKIFKEPNMGKKLKNQKLKLPEIARNLMKMF